MAPGKVTTPGGRVFFIPEGKEISHQEGFQHLSPKVKQDLSWVAVTGTREGFRVTDIVGRGGSHTYSRRWGVRDEAGKPVVGQKPVHELRDGTKIEVVTKREMRRHLRGKER